MISGISNSDLKEAQEKNLLRHQTKTLGDREQPTLDAGHGLQRGRLPCESKECGRSDEYSAEN